MHELYLIRHGHPDYELNSEGKRIIYGPDVPLSDEGKKGIGKLAKRLGDSAIDILYTSPYLRARQTADIIGNALKIPIKEHEGLHDLWVPGWVGVTFEEFIAHGQNVYNQPPRSNDQETWEQMVSRTKKTHREIKLESEGKVPDIVGHGDTLSTLLYYIKTGQEPVKYEDIESEYIARGEACKITLATTGVVYQFLAGEGDPSSGTRTP